MGSTVAIGKKPKPVRERVETFGRVGVYDAKSRDWVASLPLVEKLFPDYKD